MRRHACSPITRHAPVLGRAAALAMSLMLGACAQLGDIGLGGSEKVAVNETPANDLDKATEYWAKKNTKNPRDTKAALSYARNLKAQGRKQEALGVLQSSYLFGSEDREYLSEYGRLALELDQVNAAAKVLERADDPAKPDWRVISARGTVLAKQGDYKGAIGFFERARELAPSQASIMNNLAMAYTMDGQADKAEGLLRQALQSGTSDTRIRQNLALVVSLQGKHDEARTIRGEPAGEGSAPAAVGLAADGEPQPAGPVANAPAAKPQKAVARPSPAPAPQTAPSKPMDPDEIIRAAIEADMARKKVATPIATSAAQKRKPAGAGDPVAPTIVNAQPDKQPALRTSSH